MPRRGAYRMFLWPNRLNSQMQGLEKESKIIDNVYGNPWDWEVTDDVNDGAKCVVRPKSFHDGRRHGLSNPHLRK